MLQGGSHQGAEKWRPQTLFLSPSGKHITEKTGNIAAVQRQLGHKNAAYSPRYWRVTAGELRDVINDR